MPTIEIASVGATRIPVIADNYKLAIQAEDKLISHRGLFYEYLKVQKGIIIHLGNPEFKEDIGGYYAGALIDWEFEPEHNFKFREVYISEINSLLEAALKASPQSLIYFLTDYQFGPAETANEDIGSISNLWSIHNNKGLRFNTLFRIKTI